MVRCRDLLKLPFVVLVLGGLLVAGGKPRVCADDLRCELVLQALEAAHKLKPGMHRSDVLKDFVEDGGLDFVTSTRYLFRRCPYIKIEVEFRPEQKPPKALPSPHDEVIKISQPYVEYPHKD